MTTRALTAIVALAALALVACEREQRRFSEIAAASARPTTAPINELRVQDAARGKAEGPYAENAWAVSEGKRLYTWFNCVGCHAHGGGGMGPALMDREWLYGGAPWEIYASIVEGRPNGMPAYGGKIPDQQVWEIVAYVRSLGGELRRDVRTGRGDSMMLRPSEQATRPEPRGRGGAAKTEPERRP